MYYVNYYPKIESFFFIGFAFPTIHLLFLSSASPFPTPVILPIDRFQGFNPDFNPFGLPYHE